MSIRCVYCESDFTRESVLRKHYERCKQKPLQELITKYESQLQAQREHYESKIRLLNEQIIEQKQLTKTFQEQIFEIARQPKTTVTNNTTSQTQTHTNNRNTNIINQLALYDLTQDQITHLLTQHFNLNTFHGGPEEIAKLAARLLLTDPETQKPKVTCTDLSRKNFRYVDEEQEVQIDPGFQKTHDLIKEPLSKANIRVYVDELNKDDRYHDQWRKNEDFISDRTGFSDKLIKWML